ncbi:Putative auto-transporter adhesin, head GIN domain [Pedobacter terrae]|uniref:Putative auto-transporter adhesin, head GIN domain n=1 Tax=Pedobacter terrae TaxID=405671 RepID=A0A1G8EF12_9SPHI|nr:DUF2807 domain-containing protein [Pedobacter terrae]SDH68494.1 Putative auto-transporter adhesin, head GIN domain [Pedobacter terrae]
MKKIIPLLFILQVLFCSVIAAQEKYGNFESIVIDTPFPVEISIGSESFVDLAAVKDLVNDIKISQRGGTLFIIVKKTFSPQMNFQNRIIKISTKTLNSILNRGAGSLTVASPVKTNSLIVNNQASGAISITAELDQFTANISGSGSIKISGRSNQANIRITGSGQFLGKGFTVKKSDISISSSGSVTFEASETISARLSASGSVIYTGTGRVINQKITASGRIVKQ